MNDFDHAGYAKKVKTLSEESLKFIIKDCKDAIKANPENPKVSHYTDEIHYCAMELKARQEKNSNCPCCGSMRVEEYTSLDQSGVKGTIQCDNCGLSITKHSEFNGFEALESARKCWNKRPEK